jgi:calcineurin-like phosphoesterase family protein
MTTFVTADHHLDHANMLLWYPRPGRDVHEMARILLQNIAETVKPKDTLYLLGDLAFDAHVFRAALLYLNSYGITDVRIVKGNHDNKQAAKGYPLALEMTHNKRHYYLCHYPAATWRPNTVWLHGHCHGNPVPLPDDSRLHWRYDVGVDTEWDGRRYFPVSIEQIEARIEGDV